MPATSPFHVGETQIQARLGVREAVAGFARRMVRDHMPEQHREFYRQLPCVVVAARDGDGRPWATLIADPAGVVTSPAPDRLDFKAGPVTGDALAGAFVAGRDVGVLGIEFATRRRNRVNGRVSDADGHGFGFRVDQSFGNCPQYIHDRHWRPAAPAASPRRRLGAELDAVQQAWIADADTVFLASGFRGDGEDPAFGMDASHRGGPPGFVRVLDAHTLAWPEYAGNNHYNTLGNLVMDPRIGLLFVDFASGSLLQLSGRARIDFSPDAARWPGAQRVVEVRVEAVNDLHEALPLRWHAPAALEVEVDEVVDESAGVRSFWLVGADGASLPPFQAGQHVPLEVTLGGVRALRTYSLSSAPTAPRWRISVRALAGGRVSSHLHAAATPGARLRAGLPAGQFVLDGGAGPLVLVAGGIGVTPLASMLAEAVARGRPVTFVYAARHGGEAPLLDEVRGLARSHGVRLHVAFSRPAPGERPGIDFDSAGRLGPAAVQALLPTSACDARVCGPPGFVAAVTHALEGGGVAAARIRGETFG
ncbi:MAG: pyridoxamine 5'-phosphate oxidase family protein [Gammaproteobacteria bacterium]|nr:pyridoxamine 5'-phosphate oxidase family protein [Gammaproteobacteria bacterium]